VGATELSFVCATLVTAATEGDLVGAAALTEAVAAGLDRVRVALRALGDARITVRP
jgi:hypothetical protein